MIEIIKRYFQYSDDRGSLEGLINFGEWKEINLIKSSFDSVHGNHYHKHTTEVFIILDGEIRVVTQKVQNGKLVGNAVEENIKSGDVFLIEPFINHIFFVKKDSRWINVLSEAIKKTHPDIHRIGVKD